MMLVKTKTRPTIPSTASRTPVITPVTPSTSITAAIISRTTRSTIPILRFIYIPFRSFDRRPPNADSAVFVFDYRR